MGQQSSTPSNSGGSPVPVFESKDAIMKFMNERAVRKFSSADRIAFQAFIGDTTATNDLMNSDAIERVFGVSADPIMVSLLSRILENVTAFPLVNSVKRGKVTYNSLLKARLLLDPRRAVKYTSLKGYDYFGWLFLFLAYKDKPMYANPTEITNIGIKLGPVIANFDGVDLESLKLPGSDLVQFISFLLQLSTCCSSGHDTFGLFSYRKSKNYERRALNIVRSMDPSGSSSGLGKNTIITAAQFKDVVSTVAPHLFQPLVYYLDHVDSRHRDFETKEHRKLEEDSDRYLLSDGFLAQMGTLWSGNLSRDILQKLFVAREAGFSMRSFQAKVCKWMAPSILIVSGRSIVDDDLSVMQEPLYGRFLKEYPKWRDQDQDPDYMTKKKKTLVFAVFVNDPWKVTNKDLFGGAETTIMQLAPVQEIFKATRTGNIYFNTIGGGIGIGSSQPVIKASAKKYQPGDVSLTIDPSLEVGVFRHVGPHGSMSPGQLLSKRGQANKCFEYRFKVQDIEVWGLGGTKELEEQRKQWIWEEAESQRRKNVNINGFGEERALLELAGLVGQHQGGGSV
ncbi:HFL249Cp [Eremothecium sinecaudum]|uniref:HFL249Cp n=1 Tax=Eremothecium sinecaudum TaxID=45286 RepID=A0A0X8HU78_9SACH|nr:HFL249Cp [Eremothecium sinecaudum]AMD21607.1 HFL249Cp [Eremothecium sinecaudum]